MKRLHFLSQFLMYYTFRRRFLRLLTTSFFDVRFLKWGTRPILNQSGEPVLRSRYAPPKTVRFTITLEIPSNEKLEHRSVLCNDRERGTPPYPICSYARYMLRAVSDVMWIIVCMTVKFTWLNTQWKSVWKSNLHRTNFFDGMYSKYSSINLILT